VTPEGRITTIEKEIAAKDLPKVVADALAKKYPGARIKLVEEIRKPDKIEYYEALIVTAGKDTLEVSFDPSGKFLKEEKKNTKEKEKAKKD